MTTATAAIALPDSAIFETIPCYCCGSTSSMEFIVAQDDLTGKPGNFRFVTCDDCGLAYQNPRIAMDHIKSYYDDEYIAHRKKTDWGRLTWFYNLVMDRHDIDKDRIVRRYIHLGPQSEVLDVGCAVGTFLQKLRKLYGVRASGVDFKDLSAHPGLEGVEFHCGLFYEQALARNRFDLVTMWHFLEHDYDPVRTLLTAKEVLKPGGRIVIEVPRLDSLTFRLYRERWPGLQAPQHTVLFEKRTLLKLIEKSGMELVEYLPYGAFPPYFYVFAGAAFKLLKGRGLNLSKAIAPYFLGQIAMLPVLLAERQLNLAMQTVICRKKL
jgi:SAM-dependent methyltransferase